MSDVFQALASPVRRKIIKMLRSRDMTAGDIAASLSVSKPTLSGHFNVLKAAGLVLTERSGTTITYSLNASVVEDLMADFFDLIGRSDATAESTHHRASPPTAKETARD